LQTSIPAQPQVVSRQLFYNNSAWDGTAGASSSDDLAIAADKSALLPGGTATFANYSSYSRGLNGLMIDVAGLTSTSLSASDFAFKVGNDNNPGGATWTSAPAPTSISVRPGAGQGGSDRVTLIWADGAIQKQWLRRR
jgi:hypothetical protein